MVTQDILFIKDNGVATIPLNCPERKNAFDMDMVDDSSLTEYISSS
jgi:enoyl-CoA hydratase/carnithine racemase